jgi:hypothetical protein
MSCLQSSESLLVDMKLLLLRRGPSGIGNRNKNNLFFNKQASASIQFLLFLLLNVTSFNMTLIPSPQYELLKTPKPFRNFKPFCLWWVIHTTNISFEENERNTSGNPSKGSKAACFGRSKLQSMYNSLTLAVKLYKTLNNSNYLEFPHNIYETNSDNVKVKCV